MSLSVRARAFRSPASFALWLFWIAIWVLDLKYYNRLLRGSVHALLEVGELSKTQTHITEIQMSTRIEKSVAGSLGSFTPLNGCERMHLRIGVWTFYGLVFFARLVRVRILDLQMLRHVVFATRLRRAPTSARTLRLSQLAWRIPPPFRESSATLEVPQRPFRDDHHLHEFCWP